MAEDKGFISLMRMLFPYLLADYAARTFKDPVKGLEALNRTVKFAKNKMQHLKEGDYTEAELETIDSVIDSDMAELSQASDEIFLEAANLLRGESSLNNDQ